MKPGERRSSANRPKKSAKKYAIQKKGHDIA
jgi:hypothetical protein